MKDKDIVIVGAGGFGRELLGWVTSPILPLNVKGFLSDNPNSLDDYNLDCKIIGNTYDYKIEENDRFLLAIGNIKDKKAVIKRLEDRGGIFGTYIHDSVLVAKTAKIGKGCVIGPFSLISENVELEDFVMFGFYTSCGHDARVGKYSILSPYATVNGWTVLGEGVFMGTHSSIASRKTVGSNSMISSGSAAMQDVPDNCFVIGVPGKKQVIFNKGESNG